MGEALFWRRGEGNMVVCDLCFRHCRLPEGGTGFCGVRLNRAGVLETLVDDNVVSLALDPVEKKPLYHFLPGSYTLSCGTMGCNFACRFCQNHHISRQVAETGRFVRGKSVRPEQIVGLAGRNHVPSLSFTYNEPTVFAELMLATARLARENGLRTVMVSNGCMARGVLDELMTCIDAANIDLKAFSADFYHNICSGHLKTVLDNLVRMKEGGLWVEVTTLVIPGLNDSEAELRALARFIREHLGRGTPWHVSAFHPCYRMQDRPPTPAATIARACRYGVEEGLDFVYSGNVRPDEFANTHCPSCGAQLMTRRGFAVQDPLSDGICPHCGTAIPGIWPGRD